MPPDRSTDSHHKHLVVLSVVDWIVPERFLEIFQGLFRLKQRSKITFLSATLAGFTLATAVAAAQDLRPIDVVDESKIGISGRFVPIAGGEFRMGSPRSEQGHDIDENRHPVRLSRDFEMQATEVTQLQFYVVMNYHRSRFDDRDDCDEGSYRSFGATSVCANHPLERVTWEQALNFVRKLNEIQDIYSYRLPTEAEWEYAARGGRASEFPYSFGYNDTGLLDLHGWHYGNSGNRTHAVARKRPNSYGLYDMHGNVWEWVQDWYGTYPEAAVTDPRGPSSGYHRVLRGGSWNFRARYQRSAEREHAAPFYKDPNVGFRLVRTRRQRFSGDASAVIPSLPR